MKTLSRRLQAGQVRLYNRLGSECKRKYTTTPDRIINRYLYRINYNNGLPSLLIEMYENVADILDGRNISSVMAIDYIDDRIT